MPTLAIITAGYEPEPAWTLDLGESIQALDLPDGWKVEWCYQEDGRQPSGLLEASRFPFASYEANGCRLGAAITRNLALSRTSADAVCFLDCDDMAGAGIGVSIEALHQMDVAWVQGPVSDTHGTVVSEPVPVRLPHGLCPPGVAPRSWETSGLLPFHSAGFVALTDAVRAAGGWIAAPTQTDDTCLTMTVSEMHPGWIHDTPVALYRRHDGQVSSTAAHTKGQPHAWSTIRQRLAAIRAFA